MSIEEMIEGTKISDIIKAFDKIRMKNLNQKKLILNEEICLEFNISKELIINLIGTNELFLKISYSKNNVSIDNLNIKPKKLEFIRNNNSTKYLVYTFYYCESLIKDVSNLFIEKNNKIYQISYLKHFFENYESFKIIQTITPNYLDHLNQNLIQTDEINKLKCSDFIPNFKYYFKNHEPESIFNYNYSILRDNFMIDLLKNEKLIHYVVLLVLEYLYH